ncbi:MAG: hypothetical protein WEB13_05515 [Dehalococcoidia bacterium]|jgi:hypothetical protein
MNVPTMLRFLRQRLKLRPPDGAGKTKDQRAARKYWDAQVDDDRKRRGVTDKHP